MGQSRHWLLGKPAQSICIYTELVLDRPGACVHTLKYKLKVECLSQYNDLSFSEKAYRL